MSIWAGVGREQLAPTKIIGSLLCAVFCVHHVDVHYQVNEVGLPQGGTNKIAVVGCGAGNI
eukprot:2161572-Amphidinium_carterae.1